MAEYIDVGKRIIKSETIKTFSVVPVEYIYRPAYREEEELGFFGKVKKKKYVFAGMEPYAAVIGENNSKVSEYKSENFVETITQDLISGVASTIGDVFKIKAARSKKYKCVRPSGAMYNLYLEDIPVLITKADGREMEVRKGDEIFGLLGDSFRTVVKVIQALYVEADKNYIFYGAGIQLEDVDQEFEYLKQEFAIYKASLKTTKKEKDLITERKSPFLSLPLPGFPFGKKDSIDESISEKEEEIN